MSDELDINAIQKQLEELRLLANLDDEGLKAFLIEEVEEIFRDEEKVKELRKGYKKSVEQVEGAILMLEGLEKMAASIGENLNVSESVQKVLKFDSEPKK